MLDWAANKGLPEFMRQSGLEFKYGSAHQYRQRDQISLLMALLKKKEA